MIEGTATSDRHAGRIRVRRRRRRRPWWRRRPAQRVFLGLAGVAFLLVLDGAWAASSTLNDLSQARRLLVDAEGDLAEGNLARADRRFEQATDEAESAARVIVHPSAALASVLPGLADDVDAVRSLARATALAARAGRELVGSAEATGWDGGTIPGTAAGGVDLEIFPRVLPGLERADAALCRAEGTLRAVDRSGLAGPVDGAVSEARAVLAGRAAAVRTAADLSRLLPGFLGADEPRRYVVMVQNLSAPRGTGGFFGVYGVLAAESGDLDLEELAHTGTLGTVPPVGTPADVDARYARFGGASHFIAANYSPDFPTSAQVLLDMWERAGREPADGVIAVDSVWLSSILGATGPVETPAWPEPLTAENLSTVLNHDTFLHPRPDRTQEALGRALFGALLDGPLPARGLGSAMDGAVRERHLQVFAVREDEQALLDRLGATGAFPLPDLPLAVVWQDATGARPGYFADKEIHHRLELNADGSIEVHTEVLLRNTAPSGPPSELLGSGKTGAPVGYYGALVNVYLPLGATDIRSTVDGDPSFELVEEEFGRPVVMQFMGAPPGRSSRLRLSYRVPGPAEGLGPFRLHVIPQPALRPDRVEVTTTPVPALRERLEEAGLQLVGPGVSWTGAPTEEVPLRVAFSTSEG